jgi:tetratricopeptide (TPR) repeat protein
VLEVDDKTAGIPWEILNVGRQENVADDKPWAIRTQLVRKLRSTTFRERPDPAGRRAGVLVFGDPHCDDRKLYPELEGARREARAVAKVLGVGEPLIQAKASVMIHALLDQPYQVVHIAGHGRADGGVVMSGNQILGHELVSKMRRVPDLVFVNCCHSGQALPFGEATGAGRPERAANIARALVRIGVRCVVAAGWAVDDDAAEHFSHEFYRLLCDGVRFAEASSRARESTWREFRYSNTWAAYQCYGDPDWVLLRDTPSQAARVTPVATEREPLVASASTLIGALKTIAVLGQDQGQEQQQRARLERLDRELGVSLGKLGEVAEHFGKAYSDLGAQEQAVTWYRRAVEAENGGASSRALEQWCNMTVRLAAARAEVARQQWERDGDVQAFVPVVAAALPAFDRADAELSRLAAIHLTYERANLLGSVWKRRAIVAYAVSRVAPSTAAEVELRIARMKTVEHCRHAEGLALQQGLEDLYYPLLNRMTAEAMLDLDKPAHPADEDGVEQVQNSLERKIAQDPDFWALAQRQELKLYQGLCQRNIAAQSEEVKRGFRELRSRIRLKRSWSTLRDQTWFTLRPYASSAQISALESKAADDLIALLEAFARGEEAL